MSQTTPSPKIAPSLLSSDFARLAEEAQRMVDLGAEYLHLGNWFTSHLWWLYSAYIAAFL
jgi:hypothetical protein